MGRFSEAFDKLNIKKGSKSDPKPSSSPPTSRTLPLPSYAETLPRDPSYGVSAAEPRECRQILREMYALRVMIASLAYVQPAAQPMVRAKKDRAEAALRDLQARVDAWLAVDKGWSAKEIQTIRQIRELIMEMPPIVLPFDNIDDEQIVSDMNWPSDTASFTTNTTHTTNTTNTTNTTSAYPTAYTSPQQSTRGSMYTRHRSTAQGNSTFTS